MTFLIENMRRLAPDEIPAKPITFKRWADCACTEWPGDLMARAVDAMADPVTLDKWAFARFRAAYSEWFNLPEDQKDAAMHELQLHDPHRMLWRKRALTAASGGDARY